MPRVVEKIDERFIPYVSEVVVIDNRSSDRTLEVAKESVKNLKIKATVLRNQNNYNLGGSIKRAFLYAMEHGYDHMITLHGDDQADIRDFLPLLESGDYQKYDLAIGARFHPQSKLVGYSMVRILGNKALNLMCAVINRRPVYDLIAGLNCYRVAFFQDKFFLPFPDNLTFDAHVLLYAFAKQAKIEYVPITWREEDQVSNAKAVRQALVILRLFARYIFRGDGTFRAGDNGGKEASSYVSEVCYQNSRIVS